MTKQCNHCQKIKDESEFYRRKSGILRMPCKQCCNAHIRLVPEEKPTVHLVEEVIDGRTCPGCHVRKPLSDFDRHPSGTLWAVCRDCVAERAQETTQATLQAVRRIQGAWRAIPR